MSRARESAIKTVADYHIARYGRARNQGVRAAIDYRAQLFMTMKNRPYQQAISLYHTMSTLEPHPLAVRLLDWARFHNTDKYPLLQDCYAISGEMDDQAEATVTIAGELVYTPVQPTLDKISKAQGVRLLIDSPGGSASDGLLLYNALKACRDTEAIVTGKAWSAACVILQGCQRRKVCESATLMVHGAYQAAYGSVVELQAIVDGLNQWEEHYWMVYTRTPPALVSEWRQSGNDCYFTAQEAVKFGLADEVVPDVVTEKSKVQASVVQAVAEANNPDREAEALAYELLERLRSQFKEQANFDAVLKSFCTSNRPPV